MSRRDERGRRPAGWAGWCAAALTAVCLAPAGAGEARREEPKPAVVASVNGKVLTEPEFHRRCERLVGGTADTAVGYVVLKEWLQQVIAEEDAAARKLLPGDREIDRRVDALRKQFAIRGEAFDTWLAAHGRTTEALREEVRHQLIAENLLTEGVTVSEAEIALYYTSNRAALGVPERLDVSRISVDTRAALREVEQGLKKGVSFETLARLYSVDPYKELSGRVPGLVDADPAARGALEKEVLQRALKLEPGKPGGPFKVEDYWVFVRVNQRHAARAPELEDVRDLLVANLKVQKGGQERLRAAQERMTQLQRDAKIEIRRPEYARLLQVIRGEVPTP